MKKNTRTRFASNLMLFPAGQYLAKMLAEVFAKAKAAEATEKRPDWGAGSGPGYAFPVASKRGYEFSRPGARWKRWYKAEQKRQRQFSAIKHHRYRWKGVPLCMSEVA
jgi:hypothetical protein